MIYIQICECGEPIEITENKNRFILSQLMVHDKSCIPNTESKGRE
jgi:hypothetical protein